MKDTIKKGLFTSFGLALIAKDKLSDVAKEISKEAKLSEDDGEKLYESLVNQSDVYKKNVEENLEKMVNTIIEKLNIPTKKEVDELSKNIIQLQKEISEFNKSSDIID